MWQDKTPKIKKKTIIAEKTWRLKNDRLRDHGALFKNSMD